MTCKNCAYFWQEEYEQYPTCHFVARAPGELSPCDQEEEDRLAEDIADDPSLWGDTED